METLWLTSTIRAEEADSSSNRRKRSFLAGNQQAWAEAQRPRDAPCHSCHVSMMPFALYAGLIVFVTSALSNYLSSQITTLEKQFGWRSGQTAMLVSMNDVGFFSSILVITYFTRHSHIPRILAVCCFSFGVGAIVCALPNFVTSTSPKQNVTGSLTTHAGDLNTNSLCLPGALNTSESVRDDTCSQYNTDRVTQAKTLAFALIASGMFLQGVAKSPRIALILTYIDDNVQSSQTAFYSGITSSMLILGYTLAYSMGAAFSRIHVTLQDTLITPDDHRWVGAWWLGFVVMGTIALIIPIPLWFFPKRLSSTTQARERRKHNRDDFNDMKSSLSTQVKDIPATVVRLLTNQVYILLILGVGLKALRTAGFAAFNPKYMEVHFSLTVSKANLLGGVSASSAIIVSIIFSGILFSRLRFQFRGLLRTALLFELISSAFFLLGITISCPQPSITSLDIMSGESATVDSSLTLPCSYVCECHGVSYYPVCGQDGLTYFSPCHAGCSLQSGKGYSDCRCISNYTSPPAEDIPPEVVPGMCGSPCTSYVIFTVLQFLAWFCSGVSTLSVPLAIIRSVNHKDKSFATGLSSFVSSLVGWFLGPILFGNVIDTTCRLWHKFCGLKGACAVYDIADLRIKYHLLDALVSLAYIALFLGAYVFKIRSLSSTPHTPTAEDDQICERLGLPESAKRFGEAT